MSLVNHKSPSVTKTLRHPETPTGDSDEDDDDVDDDDDRFMREGVQCKEGQ